MIKLLKCEYKKTRKRYILLTALVITFVQMCWALYGDYPEDVLKNGYMSFLYQFPLINAIFLPLLAIVISSRLCDIEHKGVMLKQLCSISPKGKIYSAKLIYGLGIMIISILLSWIITILFGKYKGFLDTFPLKLYLLYLLFTLVPAIEIYIFQHTLSLCFKNQAISFFVGIIGEFAGIFSMFLPNIPMLRKLLIWGHFGTLQFVGMFGWTKESRMSNVYFEIMDIDWTFFVIIIIVSILIYAIGRKLFVEKEI